MMPNPSLYLTRYGRRCKPGLSRSQYRLSPGLQHMPPRAADLERWAKRSCTGRDIRGGLRGTVPAHKLFGRSAIGRSEYRMDDRNYSLNQGDAVDWLRSLPDGSVDLVVTDPPYESLEKHRSVGTTTRLKHSKSSSNDWFEVFPNARFEELLKEVYRVLRQNSHFYLFCDAETMFVVKPIAESVGFKFWKPIVWDKVRIGMGYHYRARYEFILFFEKGKRRLNDLGIADILTSARVAKGYPTEKPSAIAETLISQSTTAGDLVIDPFMGSCSVGEAAIALGRRFAGNDLSPVSVGIAHQRLSRPLSSSEPSGAAPKGQATIPGFLLS
jgi:site-specific DNA-methyltransferase (adenine-specific)